GGCLVLPLTGQELEVILPDTAVRVSSAEEVIPYLTDRLAYAGSQGRLGTTLLLGSVVLSGHPEERLTLRYSNGYAVVPPPDTLVVQDDKGTPLPNLAAYLRNADFRLGSSLQSAGQPAWKVQRKSYFGHGSGYGIIYNLEDVSRKTVQVLAAYDQQGVGAGQVVGEVTLDLPNFLGTLRYFRVHWRRLSPVTQTINLIYAEPRLPLLPLGAQLMFYQDLKDTLYLQRDLKLQLTSLPGQDWSVAVGVGKRDLQVTDHGRNQGLVPYRLQNVNLTLQRQSFDHPVNPSRGYRVNLALEGGTIAGREVNSRAALGKGQMNVAGVLSLSRLTLAQEVQALGLAAYKFNPQLAEFGRFGGSTTLRGYREDQFLAPRGLVSRTELRYRTGLATRFHLFMDLGRLAGFDNLAAAGLGMVLKAGRNLIQIDLAWSREDDFAAGKIHLRLINFLSLVEGGQP
ncbi:MAG: BamA/TamA family outer membrane protein, partial [Candidatus Neomarinimicrobiota bacterium]